MNYKKILKKIAEKEGVSAKEVERDMKAALFAAGLNCSVEEFLKAGAKMVANRLYIV